MIKVNKISIEETSRFKKIRLRSLKENPEAFGSTLETANSWDNENWISQVKNLNTFIAFSSGSDVGVVRIVQDQDDKTTAWIISMWVAPEARGKKVASKMLDQIIDWSKKNEIKCIKLDVVDTNKSAIRLYEKYNFKRNGITSNFNEPRAHLTEHQRELQL
jgi:ribosomal protein S18 acetylase RimI-like enzyme